MNFKTFSAFIIVLLIAGITSAAYATYVHPAIRLGDGKDIDLFGNKLGNGSLKDVACSSNCTGYGITYSSSETNATNLTVGTLPAGRYGSTLNQTVNFYNGNASNITSGTLRNASIPTSAANKSSQNTFTQNQTFGSSNQFFIDVINGNIIAGKTTSGNAASFGIDMSAVNKYIVLKPGYYISWSADGVAQIGGLTWMDSSTGYKLGGAPVPVGGVDNNLCYDTVSMNITTSNAACTTSLKAEKKNFQQAENNLNEINAIILSQYQFMNDPYNRTEVWTTAEELIKTSPDCVAWDVNHTKMVGIYDRCILGKAIGAIQEQQKQIDVLAARIQKLEVAPR